MTPAQPSDAPSSTTHSQQRVGAALAKLMGWVSVHPGLVLVASFLVVGFSAFAAATQLDVNADLDAMFSDELPHRVVESAYMRDFPALYENVVVVIDGESSEAVRDATSLLAERMRSEPDFFRNVYAPSGDFFEKHALLYMSTEEVEDFVDRLARVQPYLAGLGEDGTLRGLATLLARGARAAYEGDVDSEELAPIFGRVTDALRARVAGDAYVFSWAEVVAGPNYLENEKPGSQGRARRLLMAQPVLDFTELAAAGEALHALRRFADELALHELDGGRGVRVRVTGDVALSYEEMTLVEAQAVAAGIASLVMVTLLLTVALRSWRLVLAIVLALLAGLTVTAGFAALAVGHLNLISVAFAVLFIGLAADFSLHFCLRYQELRSGGAAREAALGETAHGVGPSLVLCAGTTAIGFFAFVPTDFAGVAELGLIAGVGMGIGLVTTLTIVPAVLSFGAEPAAPRGLGTTASLPTFPLRYPRGVASVAALVTFGALGLLPQVVFDQNPLRVRDPSAESVQTYRELLEQGSTSPWGMAAVAPDRESAERMAAALRVLDVVDDARTVLDFIPSMQDEKLAILEDASLFMAPAPTPGGGLRAPTLEQQLAALTEFDIELERLESHSQRAGEGLAALVAKATHLRTALRDFGRAAQDSPELVEELEESLVGALPSQLETLERLLSAERVAFEDLPEGLRMRLVSETGRVRIDIHPAEDLNDGDTLARFVESVRAVVPDATGPAVNIHESSLAVVRALQEALLAAVVVIGLLLLLIWRTLGDTLLVMMPLALAALCTSAAAVLIGIPFNFADIIVLPLLLGIGVDSGIHLVHRARMGDTERSQLLATSTARAVVFSSLTTIASFGSLAFATHRGMASLGELLTLGVTITVLCNLIVLPALIVLTDRMRARRSALRKVS